VVLIIIHLCFSLPYLTNGMEIW